MVTLFGSRMARPDGPSESRARSVATARHGCGPEEVSAAVSLAALAAIFGVLSPVRAQQIVQLKPGETMPSFEVASIREDLSGSYHSSISDNGDSYRIENVSLREVIMSAWGARTKSQVLGGPDQLMGERIDINARISEDDMARMKKLPPTDSRRQQYLMLQALLADRFHLKVHIESREMPVFALVLAKAGPKLHASAPAPAATDPQADKPKPHGDGIWMRNNSKHAELNGYRSTIDALASVLSDRPDTEGRFVINKTGLSGNYDYSLQWAPEYLSARVVNSSTSLADTGPSGPSLFTALEDQLGLKLESEKAPVEVLVIDHVEPPSAN